jgi:D-alanyl-D-alanine carboxypeptidase/D-alanyl-D-alanine-endopeptidase (penicillin-binding protein 4)
MVLIVISDALKIFIPVGIEILLWAFHMYRSYLIVFLGVFLLSACVHTKKLNHSLLKQIRKDSALRSAHWGIAVWDAEKKDYVVRHQSDHYFVPASNVKITTLYAALKYLSDTLPAFDYYRITDTLFITPKGDPTFFDGDFRNHLIFDFFKQEGKPIVILPVKWETEIYGKGWAWDDYNSAYMPEKSPLPLHHKKTITHIPGEQTVFPSVKELLNDAATILSDTLGLAVITSATERVFNKSPQTLYTSSRDSACKKMMFRSDNLIAEQLLLMASNQHFGSMNETHVIEYLLSDSILQFPQKPVWVDGSGLSRYNLFTPEDMVYILEKLENEFGADRIRKIFPTGNEGTLKGYYDDKAGFIYAKTGTLTGQFSLCGYLRTKKNTHLTFSFMINNHCVKSAQARKVVEKYIDWIWRKY